MDFPVRVVIVPGAGRSGTSLAMQVLRKCGMRVSENITRSGEQNPGGAMEDVSILAAERELRSAPHLPGMWVRCNSR